MVYIIEYSNKMLIENTSNGELAIQSVETENLGLFNELPDDMLQKITDELQVSHKVDICWDAMKNIMSPECYHEFKIEHTVLIRGILFEDSHEYMSEQEDSDYDDY